MPVESLEECAWVKNAQRAISDSRRAVATQPGGTKKNDSDIAAELQSQQVNIH